MSHLEDIHLRGPAEMEHFHLGTRAGIAGQKQTSLPIGNKQNEGAFITNEIVDTSRIEYTHSDLAPGELVACSEPPKLNPSFSCPSDQLAVGFVLAVRFSTPEAPDAEARNDRG
jgi:hypothetical protein